MRFFEHRTLVNASRERVAKFHKDSRILKRLTPPPVFVHLHKAELIGEGSITDFTMWIGPLPLRWTAVHSQVDPVTGFTDTQLRGPFKFWVHRHSFNALDEHTTEIVDQIQAEFGRNIFWGLVSRFMWLSLPLMFAYRGWFVRRKLMKIKTGISLDSTKNQLLKPEEVQEA